MLILVKSIKFGWFQPIFAEFFPPRLRTHLGTIYTAVLVIFLNHVADFQQLHFLQEVLFRILERVIHRFGNWSSYPPFWDCDQRLSTSLGIYYQIDETVDTIAKTVDNPFHLSGRILISKSSILKLMV